MTAAVRRQRDLAAGPPSIGEQQLGLAAGSSAHRLVRLISVAEPVDQARGLSLRSRTRPRVDQLTNSIMRQFAVSCDGLHRLVVNRLGEPLQCLAMRLGELGTQQHVGRILVLVPLFELRLNAEPVERCRVRMLSRCRRRAARLSPPGCSHTSPNAVAKTYGRHVSREPSRKALRPRQRRLAARSEALTPQSQLLHLPHGQIPAHLGDQSDDMPVLGRIVQRAKVGRSNRRPRAREPGDGSSASGRTGAQLRVEFEQGSAAVGRERQPCRQP